MKTIIKISTLLLVVTLTSTAMAASIDLTPLVPGIYTAGNGANSSWVQVQNNWQGPSSFSQQNGGIASLQDANAALALSGGDSGFLRSANGVMTDINAGNDLYNQDWGSSWGYANMPPLFNTGDPSQENYAGNVWGYVSIPVAGDYNFGVLYDDGFDFTIWGANASLSMSVDGLNARDRLGFDSNISMQPGLYRYDLMGYNHLEAGVLNLGWWYGPTTSDFAVIPQTDLYTASVPLPPTLWLFGSGLIGLAGMARRKQPDGTRLLMRLSFARHRHVHGVSSASLGSGSHDKDMTEI
ncbi:MAG: VPLPA-CTERM sorting domain-containing protein [Sulfuricaulis sp.]